MQSILQSIEDTEIPYIPVLHTTALCLSFHPSRTTLVDIAADNRENLPRSCNQIFRRWRTALDLAFDNFPKGVHHRISRYHSSTSHHHFHHHLHYRHRRCHHSTDVDSRNAHVTACIPLHHPFPSATSSPTPA